MINYLSLLAFIIFVFLALGRVFMLLRKRGKNTFFFGVTDKSDFLLPPIVFLFLFTILASTFGLPLPAVLTTAFFRNTAVGWAGLVLSYGSLVWFAFTLKSFGDSFRIGIDETTKDDLVTSGMFAISRNPIYVAFLAFVTGMFLIYPNIVAGAVFIFSMTVIHRQVLREEKFLRSHYGAEYENYYRRVRRYL